MAFTVILYQMDKDKNSTRRPSGPGNPYTVELKDQCSVVDPVLVFNFGQTDYPSGFNYVCIPIFENRCYWITNWQYFRGLWTATCHVDALASWRADIGNSTQYVTRSAADFNGSVVDRMYPTLASQTFSSTIYNHPFFTASDFTDGVYIVGIVSDSSTGYGGGVTYYQMTPTQMQQFRHYMLSDISWANISAEEVSEQLSKALLNPYQYVVSCKWFPFVPTPGHNAAEVSFGWWKINLYTAFMGASGYWDSDPVILRGIAKHPQSGRGEYLNLSPYTRRTLYCYPWGAIPIDTSVFAQSDTLKAQCSVDLITGDGILYLYAVKDSADVLITTLTAKIGLDVSLTQITLSQFTTGDPLQEALQAGGAALSAVIGGESVSGVANAAVSTLTNTSTKGTNGGLMAFNQDMRIVSQFFDVADEDNEHVGRPLMSRRVISTLPGYIVCSKPHIECHATADELGEIESAMSSGFYWE